MPTSNIKLLENYITYLTQKNKAIAKNIANVGTEGYRREDVVFKNMLTESMGSSLKTSNEKHIGGITFPENSFQSIKTAIDNEPEIFSGINNVDIDKEMAELAENTLRFKFASKKIGNYFRNLQNVIKGGGR